MINYPFAPAPFRYGSNSVELSMEQMNRLLFFTVFIGQFSRKVLQFVCYGVIVPLSFVFTLYIMYIMFKVVFAKHVRRMRMIFSFYGICQVMVMHLFASTFAIYYWTFGAVRYEEEYGTPKFTCIFYLYFFNFVPGYCLTIQKCTIGFMIIFDYKKTRKPLCGRCYPTKSVICTLYVFLLVFCVWDFFAIFALTSYATITSDYPDNYQQKCFVLMNPVFEKFGLTIWMKSYEWFARVTLHWLPHFFAMIYLVFTLIVLFKKHMNHRYVRKIEREEPHYYAGCVVVIIITIGLIIFDMIFNLYCDGYEISLHFTDKSTDQDHFFLLRTIRTAILPVYFITAPIAFLSLASLLPHFQSTMVRYLHDGQEIPVTKYKTIGGYLITKAHYSPLPEKLSWQAQLYKSFMRCYLASLVWDKSITMCEDFRRWLKCSKRRKEVYRQMEHDMKLRKNNLEKSELYLKVKTTKIEVENELSPEGTKADHFPKLTPSIYCCEATV